MVGLRTQVNQIQALGVNFLGVHPWGRAGMQGLYAYTDRLRSGTPMVSLTGSWDHRYIITLLVLGHRYRRMRTSNQPPTFTESSKVTSHVWTKLIGQSVSGPRVPIQGGQ